MNVPRVAIAGRNNYPAVLDEAWQQHLAPRAPDAPTVISLFAGCGGSSLGYSMAGYREVLAVERDSLACATFRLNFPAVPLYAGNIEDLTAEACLVQSSMEPGQLDVLDGSPPCQGFSTAGKRQMADVRNQLFREYVRLLDALQPKAFVMENVSGMIKGKMKLLFAEILGVLKACGYAVKAYLMNTCYFQVPQTRERMIFLGIREDMAGSLTAPAVQTHEISLREAFASLAENTSEIVEYPPWLLDAVKEIKRRETTGDRTKARAFRKYKGTTGGAMNFVRLCWDRPATTLCKSFVAQAWLGHPDDTRFLNEVEMKRIASFPDAFQFLGTFKQKVAQAGNAVPPLFMRAIARHIRQLLSLAVAVE